MKVVEGYKRVIYRKKKMQPSSPSILTLSQVMKHQVTLRTAILPEWEASQSRLLLKTSGSPDSHYCFLMWCFSCSKHEEVFGQDKLSFFLRAKFIQKLNGLIFCILTHYHNSMFIAPTAYNYSMNKECCIQGISIVNVLIQHAKAYYNSYYPFILIVHTREIINNHHLQHDNIFHLKNKNFKVNIIHVLLFYAVTTFLSTSQQTVIAEC